MPSSHKLRILHCLRAPLTGPYRYVRDLIYEQARLGYDVGIICDKKHQTEASQEELKQIEAICALGILQIPMARHLSFSDLSCIRKIRQYSEDMQAHIIHGHGAKGGAYARLAAAKMRKKGKRLAVFYTPNGARLQNAADNFTGRFLLAAERRMTLMTDGIIFESQQCEGLFQNKVGMSLCPNRRIPHGLHKNEFHEREQDTHAADFLFVGELNKKSGLDVFLNAISGITVQTPVSAVIAGDGPDKKAFIKQAKKLGLAEHMHFVGKLTAAEALPRGRCLIIPSHVEESFPFMFLEAAATEVPTISTNAGIIPEIVAGTSKPLMPTNDATRLRAKMEDFLMDPIPFEIEAELFAEHIQKNFTVERMADAIMEFYFTAV